MRREGKPQNDLIQKQPRLPLEGEGCVQQEKESNSLYSLFSGCVCVCVCVCVCARARMYAYIHIIPQCTFISQQPSKINQVEG